MVKKHLFISGRPGIGKTTLIKKATEYLNKFCIDYSGFITEELREKGRRVGFILREMPRGRECILAHVNITSPYRVGKYGVNIHEFESIALPTIEKKVPLLVIDEIGTMELFSQKFKETLKRILKGKSPLLLATIGERHLVILDRWNVKDMVNLLVINYRTRNGLLDRIIEWFRDNLEGPFASR